MCEITLHAYAVYYLLKKGKAFETVRKVGNNPFYFYGRIDTIQEILLNQLAGCNRTLKTACVPRLGYPQMRPLRWP